MASKSLTIEILGDSRSASKAFRDTEDSASRSFKNTEQTASTFAGKLKDILGGAGIGAGAALTAGFVANMGVEQGTDKVAAQLGLTTEESGRAGKLAGDLYKDAYGDSLGQVNEAIAGVSRNISSLATTSSADMERITAKVLDVTTAFDQDLGGTTAAVGQMIKTGMARDADEALDVIARGFQLGVDKSGDFLETLNEYGTQFRKLGLDGKTATGILSQGLKAGARDADIVADSLKEFSIRAIDGSDTTKAALESLGLKADGVAKNIAAGGPKAAAALDIVLGALAAMKDPAAQAATAVALFGTQAEDMGAALFALDPTKAVEGLGQVDGAAKTVGETLASNTNTTLEGWKRKWEMAASSIGGVVGPIGAAAPALGGLVTTFDGLGGVAAKAGGVVKSGLSAATSGLMSAGSAAAQFAAHQGAAAVAVARSTAALAAQKGVALAQAAATQVATVAQGAFNLVMAANPVVLVVLAIAALVAGIVLAYQHVGWFRDLVDGAFKLIQTVIGSVIDWVGKNWPTLLAILTGPIGLAVLLISKNWDTITAGISAARDWVRDRIEDVVGFVTGLPGRIARAASGMWNSISDGFKAAINFIIRGWNGLEFKVPGFKIGPIGYDGFTLGLPDIPYLAKGGTVTAGGLAITGDDGPELLNLPRGATVTPLRSASIGSTVHLGGVTINVAGVSDADDLVQQAGPKLVDYLRREARRNGPLGLEDAFSR